MGRYAYKKSLPDWEKSTAEDLKIAIKAYVLKSLLDKKSEEEIKQKIAHEVAEFAKEFDPEDEDRAAGYVQELTAFGREILEMTKNAIGNLSPYQFAAALAPAKNLTNRQKEIIGKTAQLVITQPSEKTLQQIADNYKYQPTGKDAEKTGLPDIAYNRATPAMTYYKDVHSKVTAFISDFQKIKQSSDFVANVNPRAYTEMGIRFESYQREKQRLIQQGVKTVYVAPHANCSKRCQPFQGRVYSLDGFRGIRDGQRVIPIEDAADNVTYTSRLTGRVYQAGLFSYNCRHSMVAYQEGQVVEKIPDSVINRQRNLEETQREMEREIRFQKEKGLYWEIIATKNKSAGLDKLSKACYTKAKALETEYEKFSSKNKIPVYRERLTIMEGENLYTRTARGRKDAEKINAYPIP